MSDFLISQCIAAFALVAFHFRQRSTSLRLLALSTLLLAIHFQLHEHLSAAGLMLLAALRFLIASWSTRPELCGLFCLLAILISVIRWQTSVYVFPLAGSLLLTQGSFQRNEAKLRVLTVAGSLGLSTIPSSAHPLPY